MSNKKIKSLIKLIVIILVGYLGIHKFMEKKNTLGWIYMFTLGLCGIGWIIDIVNAAKEFNDIDKKTEVPETIRTTKYKKTEHSIFYKKMSLEEIVNKKPNEYIVFDTETTGLYPESGDRIIEIALLKYKDGNIIDKFVSLVNPNCILPQKIIDLTGITDEDLITQPLITKHINQIIEFINNRVVIGHNVLFDLRFLKEEINRCDFETSELNIEYIDTLDMVRNTIYDIENNKLETLKEYFGIKTSSHRAEADCETTNEVYKRCLEMLIDKDIRAKKMEENYQKREQERLEKMSEDEKDIINHFIKVAKEHGKEIEYRFLSDNSISFTLCNISIGKIKFNGRKRFCRLFAGDFKNHEWEDVENPEKQQILEYIDDLFIYIDKEYKRYFLEYGN